MKLSLARWDYNGCSRGYWMVRELPGVAITLVDTGWGQAWSIYSDPSLFSDAWDSPSGDSWPLANRLWGEGFVFTDISDLPERRFATRSEGVLALESFFSGAAGSGYARPFLVAW